jgi:hypothetical protein
MSQLWPFIALAVPVVCTLLGYGMGYLRGCFVGAARATRIYKAGLDANTAILEQYLQTRDDA